MLRRGCKTMLMGGVQVVGGLEGGSPTGDVGRELGPCCNAASLALLLAGDSATYKHRWWKE
jgi:hypothetical protein